MQAIKLGECGFNKRKKYLFFRTKHTNYITSIWICGQIFNDVFSSHVSIRRKKKIHFVYKQQTSPRQMFLGHHTSLYQHLTHLFVILRPYYAQYFHSFQFLLRFIYISKFSHHTMQFQLYFGAPTVMM